MRPKKGFSRIAIMAGALMITSALTSCDSDTLNPRLAKNALQKEAMFADSSCVKSFTTGFYEVNPAQLRQLQQLQKAGMVELKLTSVVEKKKVSNYSYWSGYTTASQDVEHTFATVSLTDAATRYVVNHVVTRREDQEKDLKLREGVAGDPVPDYVLSDNDLAIESDVEEMVVETAAAEEEVIASADTVAQSDVPVAASVDKKDAAVPANDYEAMLAKVDTKTHDMLLGKFELVKVKEVFCPENMKENGVGSCAYIYRFVDKTPFGHVFKAPESGKLMTGKATFSRYIDMGWTVQHNNPDE